MTGVVGLAVVGSGEAGTTEGGMTSRVRIQLPLLLFGAWSGVGVFVQWGALGCQLGTDHVAG